MNACGVSRRGPADKSCARKAGAGGALDGAKCVGGAGTGNAAASEDITFRLWEVDKSTKAPALAAAAAAAADVEDAGEGDDAASAA